jgi:hypothetical protein
VPSWSDITASSNNPLIAFDFGNIDTSHYILHAKKVSRLSLNSLSSLAASEELHRQWKQARGWLEDSSRYERVPKRSAKGAPVARLTTAFVDKLLDCGVVKPVRPRDVEGWVSMFVVPEHSKERFRPIKNTRDVNNVLGKETLQPCVFPSKSELCSLVNAGEFFIALDFASYFDQFEYCEEIAQRFCFKHEGKHFRLNTLAMGQRQAVEVANTATRLMLDFPKRTRVESVIDNVIFVGSRQDVLADAATFLDRVHAVGGQLNEDTSNLSALLQTSGEWCGIALNLETKTVSLTGKILEKLRVSWERRNDWSWRNFAAHIGLL